MNKGRSLSADVRFRVWRRDAFTCTYCGRSALTDPIVLEVDHINPVILGGSHEIDNLTTACKPCNRKKGPGGRKEAGVGVLVELPPELNAAVSRVSAAEFMSRSQVVRRALGEWLRERGELPPVADADRCRVPEEVA